MQDPADNFTQDLIPAPKKRGRPATGNAKTAAQRKREQRQRLKSGLAEAFTEGDQQKFSSLSTVALTEALCIYVTRGYASVAADIMAELSRRADVNSAARRASAA